MTKNRYILFGYTMVNGEITVNESEAEIIRKIYISYINGLSLKEIAEELTQSNVVYSEKETAWSKARVMRIIDNPNYLGRDKYAQIIDYETYTQAVRIKSERNTSKPLEIKPEIELIKKQVYCGKCGKEMKRRHESKCRYKERWYCTNSECDNNVHISDTVMIKKLDSLLSRACNDKTMYKTKTANTVMSRELMVAKKELEDELCKPEIDVNKALELCIRLAECQYLNIESVPNINPQIISKIENGKENRLLILMRNIIDKVILCESGRIIILTKQNTRLEENKNNAGDEDTQKDSHDY